MDLISIEKSIIKTYKKDIWCKFTKAINKYNLISENDCIAVCISGGKDSFLMAKCFQELKKHNKIKFDLKFIMMNPGYSSDYLQDIKKNSKLLGIDLDIFDTNIFDIINKSNHKSKCYLCAKMRRGYLYDYAKKIGCNKIALGHHLDDVLETILLNMFYNGNFETMLPILDSKNFSGMKLIRPMYLINEKDIIRWVNNSEIIFKKYNCGYKENLSKRNNIKNLIFELRKTNKFLDSNILKSSENVNIDNLLGYIDKNGKHLKY